MAVAFRALAGDPLYWNLVARAPSTPVVSPAEDALFPASNLRLSDPMRPFRFGSFGGSTMDVTFDLAMNSTDGDMETWSGGVPVNWATTGGTLTQVNSGTGQVHGGTWAAKLATSGGGTQCILYRDYVVRAGEYVRLDLWSYGNGANAAQWRLQNLTTYNFFQGTDPETWSNLASKSVSSTAAWTNQNNQIHVESYQACNCTDLVTLRLYLLSPSTASATVFFDDVFLWPETDVMAVIGHTLGAWGPSWRGSTDNFGASNVVIGTFVPSPHSMYVLAASQAYRYYRLRLTRNGSAISAGSNAAAPFIGPIVIGQTVALASTPLVDWDDTQRMPQVRNETRGRAIRGHNLGRWAPRDLHLTFTLTSQAQADQLRYDLVHRGGFGQYPMLVIPHDSQQHVHWCRAKEDMQIPQTFATTSAARFQATLDLDGEGLFTPAA